MHSIIFILFRVDGLYGIIISDHNGAVYSRVMRQDSPDYLPLYPCEINIPDPDNSSSTIRVPATDPGSVLFAATVERGAKLGCGSVKTVTSVYSKYQVIYSRCYPLIITFVTESDVNRALIYTIIPELEQKLTHLKSKIQEEYTSQHINDEDH